jgi:hypothetical protein
MYKLENSEAHIDSIAYPGSGTFIYSRYCAPLKLCKYECIYSYLTDPIAYSEGASQAPSQVILDSYSKLWHTTHRLE